MLLAEEMYVVKHVWPKHFLQIMVCVKAVKEKIALSFCIQWMTEHSLLRIFLKNFL